MSPEEQNPLPIPQTLEGITPVTQEGELRHKKNLYPYVRHLLLAIAVLLALTLIFFLIYQNGKSIYDNGL